MTYEAPVRTPDFGVSWEETDGTRTVQVSGEIDISVEHQLADAFDECSRLVINMTDVTFIDSSGVRRLLAARESSESLQLIGNVRVDRILDLSGVAEFFSPV